MALGSCVVQRRLAVEGLFLEAVLAVELVRNAPQLAAARALGRFIDGVFGHGRRWQQQGVWLKGAGRGEESAGYVKGGFGHAWAPRR